MNDLEMTTTGKCTCKDKIKAKLPKMYEEYKEKGCSCIDPH